MSQTKPNPKLEARNPKQIRNRQIRRLQTGSAGMKERETVRLRDRERVLKAVSMAFGVGILSPIFMTPASNFHLQS
jgi:hypothetical protein